MKLYLHIGTEKTGTTTLQDWFAENWEALRTQGVYYPKTLGLQAHRNLSIFVRDAARPGEAALKKNIYSVEDHQAFASKLTKSFNDEYAENAGVANWVISDEQLQSHLTRIGMVKRVKQFLGDKFTDIEVLVHLRPQIDIAVSAASSTAKFGGSVKSAKFVYPTASDLFHDYDLSVEWWETVFGASNVTIVPYKKQPCMVSLLIDKLGLERKSLTAIERKNVAIDWRAMVLTNAISFPRYNEDKTVNHNRQVFIDDMPNEERLQIGLSIARQFQSRFDESNNRLIGRRRELSAGDLDPDWTDYDDHPNIHYLDDSPVFSEQLDYLVKRFNWELNLERCKTKLAECEGALAQRNRSGARGFLINAKELAGRIPENLPMQSRLERTTKRIEALADRL